MSQLSDEFYREMQQVATELIVEYEQGEVTLTRKLRAAPDPSEPWLPGLPTTIIYRLSTVVEGVTKSHINGTSILAGDLKIQCAVLATDETGAAVGIDPQMDDVLRINGRPHQIKQIDAMPASGIVSYFDIFVAS